MSLLNALILTKGESLAADAAEDDVKNQYIQSFAKSRESPYFCSAYMESRLYAQPFITYTFLLFL